MQRGNKEPFDESEKAGLKLKFRKVGLWFLFPSLHGKSMGKMETVTDFLFLGSKITTNDDYNHEIERCLLLGRKAMTSIDSMLKRRGIILPTKVCTVKAMVFPVVMNGCESWTIKKAEHWRIDAFKLWCWRRLLRVSWTSRRLNQSMKGNQTWIFIGKSGAEAEVQYFGHFTQRADSLEKTDVRKDWKQEEKGTTEDEMIGWHHWLNGHEFVQTPGDSEGQESWHVALHGVSKIWTWLRDWTAATMMSLS